MRSVAVMVAVLCCSTLARAEVPPPRLLPDLELTVAAVPAALPLAAQLSDAADPQPSSGMGKIIAGWILTGLGVLNLATLPICFADFYPRESEDLCVVLSAVIGGAGLSIGIPLLIVGYNQRSDYKAWQKRHGRAERPLGLRLALDRGAALVLYAAEY